MEMAKNARHVVVDKQGYEIDQTSNISSDWFKNWK